MWRKDANTTLKGRGFWSGRYGSCPPGRPVVRFPYKKSLICRNSSASPPPSRVSLPWRLGCGKTSACLAKYLPHFYSDWTKPGHASCCPTLVGVKCSVQSVHPLCALHLPLLTTSSPGHFLYCPWLSLLLSAVWTRLMGLENYSLMTVQTYHKSECICPPETLPVFSLLISYFSFWKQFNW